MGNAVFLNLSIFKLFINYLRLLGSFFIAQVPSPSFAAEC